MNLGPRFSFNTTLSECKMAGSSTGRTDRNLFDSIREDYESDQESENVNFQNEDSCSDEEPFVEASGDEDEYSPNVSSDSDSLDSDDERAEGDADATNEYTEERVRGGEVVRTRVMKGKDGTEWRETPETRGRTNEANLFSIPRNRTPNTQNAKSPVEIFELLLSVEILNIIVEHTNEEGVRMKGNKWRATDKVEIDALVGMLLYLGAQKDSKTNIETIWTPLIGQDFIRACMSKNRFFELLSCLRFDRKETRRRRLNESKLAHIKEVLDIHNGNLRHHYTPGAYLTVDEQLIPFRGRCSFIQYMPSKPANYGIKQR